MKRLLVAVILAFGLCSISQGVPLPPEIPTPESVAFPITDDKPLRGKLTIFPGMRVDVVYSLPGNSGVLVENVLLMELDFLEGGARATVRVPNRQWAKVIEAAKKRNGAFSLRPRANTDSPQDRP